MTEESKNEETLRIEISHFASSPRKETPRTNKAQQEEKLGDNTMKISIERKNNKKSVINVNVNETQNSGKEGSENIKIKIEKNNNKKEKKEPKSPRSPKSTDKEQLRYKSPKRKRKESIVVNNDTNSEAMPDASVGGRRDAFGNPIKRGDKNYKISFKDYLTKNKYDLVKIVEVESFKRFNTDISDPENQMKGGKCCGNGCIVY